MDIEIIKFTLNQVEPVSRAREIRYKVFVEEQQVPEELEYDEFEAESQHYLLVLNEKAVATCRWRHAPKGIKLERFAVLHEYRGKGLGEALVKHVLKEVLSENKPIYIHAQEKVVGFYKKLGFMADGERFVEAGIGHFLMNYDFRIKL
jgi:predicted GNAT family N-acyltransferase